MLHKINLYLSKVVINETDKVLSTAMRRNLYWAPNILMNVVKNIFTCMRACLETDSMLLAIHTILAEV